MPSIRTPLLVGAAAGLGVMGPAYFLDYSDPFPGTLLCVHQAGWVIDRAVIIRTTMRPSAAAQAVQAVIGSRVPGHGFVRGDWGSMYVYREHEVPESARGPWADCNTIALKHPKRFEAPHPR